MKPDKEFDCVRMKAEIQDKLLREIAEFGEEEAGKRRNERLSRDPILARFLQNKMASERGSRKAPPAA